MRSEHDTADAWKQLSSLCRTTGDAVGEAQALVERSCVGRVSYDDISSAANRINQIFVNQQSAFESEEKRVLVRRLVEQMEERIDEATPTDLGRLAWLCLHLKDRDRAAEYAAQGLVTEPDNQHLLNLHKRLSAERRLD